MNRGYIRTWRKVLDSGWLKNHKLWAFWSYCLLKASHKEFDAIVGLQVIHLMPGQFIFGRKIAAKETGLTEQEIRTVIAFLKTAGNLTIKSTNKYSVITIVNWDIYQGDDVDNQPSNQQTTNQQLTTYKHIRKNNIFIVPSVEDVSAYCEERNNSINPQTFIDHYTATGWMIGKNKMKDWKAAVRTWESKSRTEKQESKSSW